MTMMLTATVGIVDDEALFRAGVRGALERTGEFDVVGEAWTGDAALTLAKRHCPRVLVMGFAGLTMVRRIRDEVPGTGIVLLADPGHGGQVVQALRAGAAGFLLRNGHPDDLVSAVRVVAAGDVVLCPSVTRTLVEQVTSGESERREAARRQVFTLTEREREVLTHIAKGMGNIQIARTMWLSQGCVKAHLGRVFTKLGCENRVQAALIARDADLAS